MTFSLSDLIGKTITINNDVSGIVESVNGLEIKLQHDSISKYFTDILVESETATYVTARTSSTTTVTTSNTNIATVGSSLSNVYVSGTVTATLYMNKLPEDKYVFPSTTDRDTYFVNNPNELVPDVWVKAYTQDYKYINNETITTGTAQSGTSTSITLSTDASSSSTYVGKQIRITGGTGSGQSRPISSYNGSTKIANVSISWGTTPDDTSVYEIYTGVWTEIPIEYEVYVTPGDETLTTTVYIRDISILTGSSNPITGSFIDTMYNLSISGNLYINTKISKSAFFTYYNTYKIVLEMSDFVYKNCKGDIIEDGDGCIPKSLINQIIWVVPDAE